MENKFVTTEHLAGYMMDSNFDGGKLEMPSIISADALTAPTRRQMNSVKNQFEAWYESSSPTKPLMQLSKTELADVVKNFYMTTRKKDGNPYKFCSYLAIRRCLSLIFQFDYGLKHVDISCDPEFLDANVVFSQMSHSLRGREENFGVTESWRLTPEKLKKLYTEGQLDFYNTQNPKVLLQTTYFYICYYTGISKISVMRQVCMNDVQEVIENGRLIAYNFDLRKYLPSERGVGPFTIYEIQGKPWCPVLTIREYLSHLNKNLQYFFQKPMARTQCFGSEVWFKKSRFKDIYPLPSMCRDASIDPPLTSGCFNKARISAEIRYEMSFVYAKLFPQCFNSTDELEAKVKQNVAKRKRSRKGINAGNQRFNARGGRLNGISVASVCNSSQSSIQASSKVSNGNSFDLGDDSTTSPSMVVSRNYQDNTVFLRPVNPATVGSEVQLRQRDELPTISVTSVFSCRKNEPVSASYQPPNAANRASLPVLIPAKPGAMQLTADEMSKDLSSLTEMKKDVISIDDDTPEACVSPRCTTVYLQQEARYSTVNSESSRSQNTDQLSTSLAVAQSNRVSVPQAPLHAGPVNDASHYATQPKRTRFDNSSHTFLREISASAREQGKGAVMLLLSLLDDISNNRGKDLLKDILQEMRIV